MTSRLLQSADEEEEEEEEEQRAAAAASSSASQPAAVQADTQNDYALHCTAATAPHAGRPD